MMRTVMMLSVCLVVVQSVLCQAAEDTIGFRQAELRFRSLSLSPEVSEWPEGDFMDFELNPMVSLNYREDLAIRLLKYSNSLRSKNQDQFISSQYLIYPYLRNARGSYLTKDFYQNVISRFESNRNPREYGLYVWAIIDSRNVDERFLTERLRICLEHNDKEAISICYFRLSSRYRMQGLYDLSLYHLNKAISFLDPYKSNRIGSITGTYGWTNHTSMLGVVHNFLGNYEEAIDFSIAARDTRLNMLGDSSNVAFTSCNIAFAKLMMGSQDDLRPDLYRSMRIARFQNDNPALTLCYEMMGFYYLNHDQLDSSEYYLNRCSEMIDVSGWGNKSPAGFHIPNYYLAQIRVKQGNLNSARNLLEDEIPRINNVMGPMLQEYHLLIQVLLDLGEEAEAKRIYMERDSIQVAIETNNRKKRVLSFETEKLISDAENAIGILEAEKKTSQVTRNYLGVVAIMLLVFGGYFFNRFRFVRKQKKIIDEEKRRSEGLLLNILPEEVARELKEKGEAEAHLIDEVTVIFTDFRGFTAMSEILSPKELVKDLNECFSAFDLIMEKHGLEKIKTIGDAYMAAGGLPTPSDDHAEKVIRAAFEMAEFIEQGKAQKIAAGLPYFEIRIGIHTGPVVAGIVGVKKFQYDIWGDTVNTASRMESSGEVGKVNISQNTYELVRESRDFTFESRGKVQAKGKGEMEMWFVDRLD